jgi:hypothetical protein
LIARVRPAGQAPFNELSQFTSFNLEMGADHMAMHMIPRRQSVARRRSSSSISPFVCRAVAEALEARQLLSAAPRISSVGSEEISAGAQWLHLVQQNRVPKPTSVGPDSGGSNSRAPALTSTIEGITFDENGNNNFGALSIPPDPHGAAGPNHVVSVTNTSIEWHTKAGAQQNSQSLSSFFGVLGPLTTLFDPKCVYDTYDNRFIVEAGDQTDTAFGGGSNTSRIFIAVSDDNDPNGVWRFHAINTKINILGLDRWADFPVLGVDSQAVYLTANMFSFGAAPVFGASRLWIIDKNPFYTAAGPNAAVVTVNDPSTAAGLPGQAGTLIPAKMYGAGPAGMGTFLVNTSFVSGANEAMSIIKISSPLAAPTFSNTFIILGDIHNGTVNFPDAPQSGSGVLIDAGNLRALDAVWRNNNLYVVNTVNPNVGVNAGQPTARWYRFTDNGIAAPALGETGEIGGEDIAANTSTFFPSVAVDNAGDVAIGFAASASTIFAGAYYTMHGAADAAGSVQSSGVLAAGLASYVRTFGGGNRWGDYSATVIDPSNDSFWIFNQYADTQGTPIGGEVGRWRTRWGNFAGTVAIPAPGTPDLTTDTGTSPTDNITNDNTPTFSGTGQNGLTVIIRANGVNVGSGVVAGGTYTITTSVLADNNYNITAEQTNGATTSPTSAALPVTIDTLAPSLVGGAPTFNFLTAAHSLAYAFNENVGPALATGDLAVVKQPATPVTTSLSYNGGTNVGTFTFPTFTNGTLTDGRYNATLTAAGVTDIAGNPLAGGNNLFNFFFLLGDANHDATVNLTDFNALAANFGASPRNFTQGDFDYNSTVNLTDFNILAARFGTSVAPQVAASSRAPEPIGAGTFSNLRIGDASVDDELFGLLN